MLELLSIAEIRIEARRGVGGEVVAQDGEVGGENWH